MNLHKPWPSAAPAVAPSPHVGDRSPGPRSPVLVFSHLRAGCSCAVAAAIAGCSAGTESARHLSVIVLGCANPQALFRRVGSNGTRTHEPDQRGRYPLPVAFLLLPTPPHSRPAWSACRPSELARIYEPSTLISPCFGASVACPGHCRASPRRPRLELLRRRSRIKGV